MKVQGGVGFPDRVIGSGFFIDKRGYLLTNYHVITSEVDPKYEGYSRLYVRLPGSQDKIPAKVVGWDRIFDIALLKVEFEPSFVFSFDTKEELGIGEKIFAIGSPGGLESTLTAGIVSATGRRFLPIGDVIQVDVPINAGNSGGPLLDQAGELVGVVFAGIEQFEGINFAIPAHWVHGLLAPLYAGGEVSHPWIGLALAETDEGLEVLYVAKGSPAERSGIRVSDILTSVNGIELKTIRNGQKELLKESPGTIIPLALLRNGAVKDIRVCLDARPFSPIESALKNDSRENLIYALFGMKIDAAGKTLGSKNYLVTKVFKGSVADETGLSENDPLSILSWQVDLDSRVALLQIRIKKRKAGFIESAIQLGTQLDVEYFL
jgi:S1-C subfamily serine protease